MNIMTAYRNVQLFLILILSLSLTGCFEEPTSAVSYGAVSYIDEGIVSVIVNGEGGVLNVYPHAGGGGEMCCVVIPQRWKPGLKATIKWQMDGDWVRDSQGVPIIENGKNVLIQGPWKQKIVDIPEYKERGDFMINFFPNDEVKVLVTNVGPGHPNYPYPVPDPEGCWEGIYNHCTGK